MDDGTCHKNFPKQFLNETYAMKGIHYITYKRLSPAVGGKLVTRPAWRGSLMCLTTLDNYWVVPYDPKLTRILACHSSVELCISRAGNIKKLFKYVCKCVMIELQ